MRLWMPPKVIYATQRVELYANIVLTESVTNVSSRALTRDHEVFENVSDIGGFRSGKLPDFIWPQMERMGYIHHFRGLQCGSNSFGCELPDSSIRKALIKMRHRSSKRAFGFGSPFFSPNSVTIGLHFSDPVCLVDFLTLILKHLGLDFNHAHGIECVCYFCLLCLLWHHPPSHPATYMPLYMHDVLWSLLMTWCCQNLVDWIIIDLFLVLCWKKM